MSVFHPPLCCVPHLCLEVLFPCYMKCCHFLLSGGVRWVLQKLQDSYTQGSERSQFETKRMLLLKIVNIMVLGVMIEITIIQSYLLTVNMPSRYKWYVKWHNKLSPFSTSRVASSGDSFNGSPSCAFCRGCPGRAPISPEQILHSLSRHTASVGPGHEDMHQTNHPPSAFHTSA